jgi:Pentapeptide repeats (8 copies)
MSGDVMRTQGSRWRSATFHSVFLVLVVTLLTLVGLALLRRPDREAPAEQGGLGWLTSNLLHNSGFALLGLAVLILVAGCILVFPRALIPDTLLDKRRVMPLGEFTAARNDARSALINAVAGLLLGLTAVFTWQQLAISREGQITERFTRAVELLGSDDLAVRVGAIRALERLSKDSRSDELAIYGLLNAYIRHHSPYRPVTAPAGPATGIGDAATEARQQERAERVDCEGRFPGLASLQKCAFDVYLALQVLGQRPATLSDGHSFAPLLVDTDLRGAQLGSARFHSADLRGAVLDDLSCYSPGPPTDLGEASLQGASLKGARFYGADLRGAHLENAKLTGADLTGAKLAGATYDTRTRFPDGFDPETHGLLLVPDAG